MAIGSPQDENWSLPLTPSKHGRRDPIKGRQSHRDAGTLDAIKGSQAHRDAGAQDPTQQHLPGTPLSEQPRCTSGSPREHPLPHSCSSPRGEEGAQQRPEETPSLRQTTAVQASALGVPHNEPLVADDRPSRGLSNVHSFATQSLLRDVELKNLLQLLGSLTKAALKSGVAGRGYASAKALQGLGKAQLGLGGALGPLPAWLSSPNAVLVGARPAAQTQHYYARPMFQRTCCKRLLIVGYTSFCRLCPRFCSISIVSVTRSEWV